MSCSADKHPVIAIIQARMGSTRLPHKVMAEVVGRPVIWHVVNRVQRVGLIREVLVATTTQPSDDVLVKFCKEQAIKCLRGSEHDVLDRYYQAAKQMGASTVVRITADCPLIDPRIVGRAIEVYLSGDYDHVSTAYPVSTFPDGLDVEVFSIWALEKAWREASLCSEREHVTPYIWKNPHIFRLKNIINTEDLSGMRWTVDDERDLEFVREVYSNLDDGTGRIFGMHEVLNLLGQHPEILKINQGIQRNEGYKKSLREDKEVQVP